MAENENGLDESPELTDDDLITFTDEDGKTYNCAILAVVEFEERLYATLAPVDQLEDGGEDDELDLFVFQVDEDDDGNQSFAFIEDEERYNRVTEFLSTLMDQGAFE